MLEYVRTLNGVDVNKYQACVENKAAAPLVQADVDFATANRLAATPTLFVNGYKMQGVNSAEQLRNIIRQRLEQEQKACTQCK
jgi:protein-disulfide isomerase